MIVISIILLTLYAHQSTSYYADSILHRGFKRSLSTAATVNDDKLGTLSSTIVATERLQNGDFSRIVSVSDEASDRISVKWYQKTSRDVPRSYLSSLLLVGETSNRKLVDEAIEQSLQWYLDNGGRIRSLYFGIPSRSERAIMEYCHDQVVAESRETQEQLFWDHLPDRSVARLADPRRIIAHCSQRISTGDGDAFVQNDIIGRLLHDIGEPKESIDYYTKALQLSPSSASTFRNLGSAYHAIGNLQLAFASYQQAIQLDPAG